MNDYDRVTDVLKFFSGMDKIPEFVLVNAATRGTAVHQSCESIIKGLGEMPIKQEWQPYVESFKKWYIKQDFNIIMPERMFCDEIKITGLIDMIYEQNGVWYIVDLKTSAQENKTWQLQLSAYAYLMFKCMHISADCVYVIMLDKDGGEPKLKNYKIELEEFFHCLFAYRRFFKDKKDQIDIELI